MKVDIVCPLYQAENYIDGLIAGIISQTGIEIGKVIFPITEWDGMEAVLEKITGAGYEYFLVKPNDFSHSLTRERAIFDFCVSDTVIMLTEDVKIINHDCFYKLAEIISNEVVYAYGKQVCPKKTIEYYIRKHNYGKESRIIGKEDIEKLQLHAFFASDAFAAYYRPVFVALNGYGGKNMMMNEDMYYAKKVLDNGYKKGYAAEAVVEHAHKFTLKQLYKRYFETGKWFAEHPEFDNYKTTDSGLKLAFYVLGQALKHFNIPVLFRWLPDISARYLGMKKGKKSNRA